MHDLAVLLGKPPKTPLNILQTDLPLPASLPATGLPADLLAQRPDIKAAEIRLAASDWHVSAAQADRLPSISLSASAIYGQGDFDVLFDNWLLSLAGNLTAPVFDARKRAAEVERVRAASDQQLWDYRQTVLTAIKEVEDALINEAKQREYVANLEQVLLVANRALDEAVERYRNGLSDYLPVLTQILAVQNLERNLIKQKSMLLANHVNLYRTLGGSWMSTLEPEGFPLQHKGNVNDDN